MYANTFEGLGEAFSLFLVPETLLILTVALLVGMFTSILPGIGSVTTLALMLSFTFGMEPHIGIAFLIVLIGAGGFSGSMTAILINVPGETQNAATLLDGYPMSQQGRAGEAIGAAAVASALGAAFGVVVLVLLLPVVRQVILAFGPPEMFAIVLCGIALIAVITRGNAAKGVLASLVGMGFGFIGMSQAVGQRRYTFDLVDLYDGLGMVPFVIGLFALPELYELLRQNKQINRTGRLPKGGVRKGMLAVLQRPWLLIRSSAIGTGVGIIPGVGASVAQWVAYFAAKASSKDPDSFGKGNIEGVIAPEASNDSKDGGALLPVLAFGIPGSLTMAIVLSSFLFHGVVPGQRLFDQNMPLVWMLILALLFANFMTSIVGLAFANLMMKLTLVPAVVLAPIVITLALVGSYVNYQRTFSIVATTVLGFLAIAMRRAGYPPAPMVIGFVLMPLAERYFLQSIRLARGEYTFLLRPITFTILVLMVAALVSPAIKAGWKRARAGRAPAPAGALVGGTPVETQPTGRTGAGDGGDTIVEQDVSSMIAGDVASPRSAILVSGLFLAFGLLLALMSVDLNEDARLFPTIVLVPWIGLSAVLLAAEVRRYVALRRHPTAAPQTTTGAFPDWWVSGWLVALPVFFWVFGIGVGGGLYVFLARLLYERKPFATSTLRAALVFGLATYFAIPALFERFFSVRLMSGALFGLF